MKQKERDKVKARKAKKKALEELEASEGVRQELKEKYEIRTMTSWQIVKLNEIDPGVALFGFNPDIQKNYMALFMKMIEFTIPKLNKEGAIQKELEGMSVETGQALFMAMVFETFPSPDAEKN